jgi:hypothetical protein
VTAWSWTVELDSGEWSGVGRVTSGGMITSSVGTVLLPCRGVRCDASAGQIHMFAFKWT